MKSFMEKEYKLKEDPFSEKSNVRAPMAGRTKQKKMWQQIIRQRTGQRANSFNFISGDYGLGKSFTLYKIVEEVKKSHSNILPISMKLLPEDTVRKFGLEFVQRIFGKLQLKEIKGILSQSKVRDYNHLKSVLHEPGAIFEKIKNGDELAFFFLRGDRVFDNKEMKKLGIVRKLDSTEKAKEYLLAFLYLLKKAKIDTLLLAIDEVEYIFSQMRGSKISLAFNTLRGFYDLQQCQEAFDLSTIANMILFFGISDEGLRKIGDLNKRERAQGGPITPFMDRKDNIINLGPLSKEETRELIVLRLRQNRTTGELERKPLIPFTEEFVTYVFELTMGKPRAIVDRCDWVLLDGLEQEIPLITVDFAKKVLESRGVPTETK